MTPIMPTDGCVIVTGAGSGLGRALAIGFAEAGFKIVGVGRTAKALEETSAACPEGRFDAMVLDLADVVSVDAAVANMYERNGPIAILVNNAAVYPRRDFLDETAESFQHSVAVNLCGVMAMSHAVLRRMAETGQGRILNVATFADLHPLPGAAAYSVSKGAARILTRAMIADLSDRFPGIVIGDWMPGMLATGMGIPDGLQPEVSAKWGVTLARMRDPSLNGTVFEMDHEILPARGLKGKVKDLVTFNRPKPRRL